MELGSEFNGRDRYLWLQQKITVPGECEGKAPAAYFDFGKTMGGTNGGFESLLYINGHPYQAVDSNHKDVDLCEFAGQEIELTFLLWSGLEGGGTKKCQYHRLSEAWVGYRDKNLEELYYLVDSMTESLPCLPEESREKLLVGKLLEQTLRFIDWDEEMLERMGAVSRIPGFPKVKAATAGEFFDKLHKNVELAERVPVWDGELYLEYHRGTYTSQAYNKKQNRKIECALCETEWL